MTVLGKDGEGYDIVECDACGKRHQANNGEYIGCFKPTKGLRHYCNDGCYEQSLMTGNLDPCEAGRAIENVMREAYTKKEMECK